MSPEDPDATTPPAATAATASAAGKPVPGNLWSDFLRRNLLLASIAGASAMRSEPRPEDAPPAGPAAG